MPTRGKEFWKFSNSLTSNAKYFKKIKNQIFVTLRMLDQNKITDNDLRWEFFKVQDYEIYHKFFKKTC